MSKYIDLVRYRAFSLKNQFILYQILPFSCTFGKLFVSLHHKNINTFLTLKVAPDTNKGNGYGRNESISNFSGRK